MEVCKINEYYPCISFELPQKNKVGDTLQSFYDEISKYESRISGDKTIPWLPDPEVKKVKDLKAELAELRLFGGLSIAETAEALGLSAATVKRHWSFAKAWLGREMGRGSVGDEKS